MLGRTKPSPKSLKERLATTSEELNQLHRDLYWLAEDSDTAAQVQNLGDLNFDQIMAVKLAVDNLRELLWKYVDAVARVEPQRVQEAMETYRVRRVSQLLELLRQRLGQYSDQSPVSFIEKVSASIKDMLTRNDGKAA
jgi:hypothetical protein